MRNAFDSRHVGPRRDVANCVSILSSLLPDLLMIAVSVASALNASFYGEAATDGLATLSWGREESPAA